MPANTPTPTTTDRVLLRPREAAETLGISDRTLWSWTRAGLPCVRVGKAVRYRPEALRA